MTGRHRAEKEFAKAQILGLGAKIRTQISRIPKPTFSLLLTCLSISALEVYKSCIQLLFLKKRKSKTGWGGGQPLSTVHTFKGRQRKESTSSRDTGENSSQKGMVAHKPWCGDSIGFWQDGRQHEHSSSSQQQGQRHRGRTMGLCLRNGENLWGAWRLWAETWLARQVQATPYRGPNLSCSFWAEEQHNQNYASECLLRNIWSTLHSLPPFNFTREF